MADILTLQAHAREAELLREHPAFRRVYDRMYQTARNNFENSAPDKSTLREEAYWTMRTLRAFEDELTGATKALDLESRRQERQERRSER